MVLNWLRHQMSRDLLSNGSTFWKQLQAALVEIRQDAIQIAVDLASQIGIIPGRKDIMPYTQSHISVYIYIYVYNYNCIYVYTYMYIYICINIHDYMYTEHYVTICYITFYYILLHTRQ